MLPCHATTNLNTFDFTPQPLLPLKKETYTVYYILYLLLLPARPKTIHCKNSSPPPPPHVLGSVHTLLTKLSCSRCLSVCLVSSPSGQYSLHGRRRRRPKTRNMILIHPLCGHKSSSSRNKNNQYHLLSVSCTQFTTKKSQITRRLLRKAPTHLKLFDIFLTSIFKFICMKYD